jgi:phosphoserine phosphatase RsbU/P
MLILTGTDGTRAYTFELAPGAHQLGRDATMPYCIPHSTVSRAHALIEFDPQSGELWISDLGSHNGTLVNGVRISGRARVRVGDKMSFGQTDFKLRAESATGVTPRSTAAALSAADPDRSVVINISEALKPLPSKVTELPELLPALSEMARTPMGSESREAMLEKWLKLVNRVIPADRLAILMMEETTREVYVAATLLTTGRDSGSFTLSRTIVNEIMSQQNALLISDPHNDPKFASQQSIIMSPLRSAIAVPLFDENRVLGILYVDTSNPLHHYNEDYLRLLATFGNIIASRLLNYALMQERQERQIYEAELRRAAAIQQNLLSRVMPEFPGYLISAHHQQCRAVGGDLYDLVVLPNGKLVLCVADVSGKGLGAALLMSNILASFRILYNVTRFSLSEVVALVSNQLHRCSAAADFATLFVGVIDPASHELTYINAGHNPPLLLRENGGHEYLPATGVMIGAFEGMIWEEARIRYESGDMLFVYTDGVTEAQRGEEQYSEGRLERLALDRRALNPEEFLSAVIDDVNRFLDDAPRSDDITMLAVKRMR